MKKNKPKVVYKPDEGQTIYSMAALEGKTPEDLDKREEERKKRITVTRKERRAMIAAAFEVYGPMLLIMIVGFSIAAVIIYLFLK
ncbi:MAG: hypothetical protein J1G02_05995 [Clostridiales bacterium]|nr:hypothetical protein [Clostridiales bacterium]